MPALSSRVAFASSSSNPSSVAAPVGQGSGERFPRPLQSQELLSWTDPVTGSSITRVNRIVIDNAIPDKKSEFNFYLPHAYAKPNTTPRIRKAKYTF